MTPRIRDPRQEKDRDLASHCRNTYGNSDKAARRGVRRKKRVTARGARRKDGRLLGTIQCSTDVEDDKCAPGSRRHPGQKMKWPDQPLGKVLARGVQRRIRTLLADREHATTQIDGFLQWCEPRLELATAKRVAWQRFLCGLFSWGTGELPLLTLSEQRQIHAALKDYLARSSLRE